MGALTSYSQEQSKSSVNIKSVYYSWKRKLSIRINAAREYDAVLDRKATKQGRSDEMSRCKNFLNVGIGNVRKNSGLNFGPQVKVTDHFS